MVNRFEDISKLKVLFEFDFGVKKYVKVVIFEDDKKVRENFEVVDLVVFKLLKFYFFIGLNIGF